MGSTDLIVKLTPLCGQNLFMSSLHIENLTASIGDEKILNNLKIDLPKGEVHAIMGPNGSGKGHFQKSLQVTPITRLMPDQPK